MALATQHKRRLRVLEEQQALRGASTPPEIIIEIEDIARQIADLDAQLALLRAHD
jgi:hypothetical protein